MSVSSSAPLGDHNHNGTSNGQTRYLGVTPPIAVNGPSKREIEVTDSLLTELQNRNCFESEAESKLR